MIVVEACLVLKAEHGCAVGMDARGRVVRELVDCDFELKVVYAQRGRIG